MGCKKLHDPYAKIRINFITTEEFPDCLYVGCGNIPESKTGLCETCKQHKIISDSETCLITNEDNGIYGDPITGCNVSREDRYVD